MPLQHPSRQAELSLATDASDSHIGGAMHQKSSDYWRPLGFFSRKLFARESRYCTFDRELLAAYAFSQQYCVVPGYAPGPSRFQQDGVLHHAVYTILPVQSTVLLVYIALCIQ